MTLSHLPIRAASPPWRINPRWSAVKKSLRRPCASARESFVPHFSVHAIPPFIICRAKTLAYVTRQIAACTMGG
jgi:hypothetical protein